MYLPGAGELAIFCVALAGAALGFLWYNAHPAEVFMGDTGSLALGGALGAVALLLKTRVPAGDRGRRLRGRGALGDRAGRLLQVHGAADTGRASVCC